MAFTYFPNTVVGTHGQAVIEIKTRLIAAGWTVQDSGDGFQTVVLAGIYGAGTDVISTSHTTSSYVANSINNFRAWFRIRSPAGLGGCELVFFHSASNPGSDAYGAYLVPVSVSNALWSGADAGSPGDPPAGTLIVTWSTSVAGSNTIQSQSTTTFDGDASTARHLDIAIGDASEGYAWYAFSRTAARRYWRGWALDWMHPDTLHSDDAHPYALLITGSWVNRWLDAIGTARTAFGPWGGQNTNGEAGSNPADFAIDEGDPITTEPIANRRGRVSAVLLQPQIGTMSGNQGTDLGLNPYNSQCDVFRGGYWYYRSSRHEDFTIRGSPRFPGLKGKSRLFHMGGGGVTDCAVATGEDLIAMGSGRIWGVWDDAVAPTDPGGGAITAAVTVNMFTFMDVTYNNMTVEVDFAEDVNLISTEPVYDGLRVPLAGPYETYVNRVWDTVAGGQVAWATSYGPDTTGQDYPGPGTFGVQTSDYCVERLSIVRW